MAEVQEVVDTIRQDIERKLQGSSVTIALTTQAVA
jgi:predicted RNA binding protein with dsRBD fold (UPF0201 family)